MLDVDLPVAGPTATTYARRLLTNLSRGLALAHHIFTPSKLTAPRWVGAAIAFAGVVLVVYQIIPY